MTDSKLYWLASYPKSGNTWTRTFIQNLVNDGDDPADINDLRTGSVGSSRAWLDLALGFDTADLTIEEIDRLRPLVYDWTASIGAGYFKIHDALWDLKDGDPIIGRLSAKGVVYIIRNPLDVAPSYAHHNSTSIDTAIEQMGSDDHSLSGSDKALKLQTRQKLLSWSNHVRSWTEADWLNLLIIRYEDLHTKSLETFSQIAEFLGLPTDEDGIAKAIGFSEFRNLQRQENSNGFRERPPRMPNFFRSGETGAWRRSLSDCQVEKIIADHGEVMKKFNYIDTQGRPI